MDANALLAEANKLPVDDRIRLVQDIWDGIAEEPATVRLSDAQKRELDRRITAYEANPDDVLTWEEVKASFMDDQTRVGLTKAQKQELDRRIAALDENPDELISWEDLKARLRRRRS